LIHPGRGLGWAPDRIRLGACFIFMICMPNEVS